MAQSRRQARIRVDAETGPLLEGVVDAYISITIRQKAEARDNGERLTSWERKINRLKRLREELRRTIKEEGW